MKWLISKLLPSNETLAKKAAAAAQSGVNSTSEEKAAVVAKYATLGNELAAISTNLTEILKDGRVNDIERDQLEQMLVPLFAKAREVIGY